MVSSPLRKSAAKSPARAARTQSRRPPAVRLDAAMPCDAAFRIVARRCLKDLTSHHAATCQGDADALHHMRIAITQLRTSMSFFSPMVAGPQQTRIRDELKWLNTHLGVVRDLDVAIERLGEINQQSQQADDRSWKQERAVSQRHLARVLRSTRYQRLVKSTAAWVEKGAWSRKTGTQAAKQRACPVADYSTRQLARWQKKLLKKSRRLREFGIKKRHRLRLLNKKLNYAIASIADLISSDEMKKQQQATAKCLRKAQKSLGQLNDDARGRSLAATVGRGGALASEPFLSPKREKLLLRNAAAAYKRLAELKPLRI
jgi:CHAD domain-containing protein